jgi:hypothetical protein
MRIKSMKELESIRSFLKEMQEKYPKIPLVLVESYDKKSAFCNAIIEFNFPKLRSSPSGFGEAIAYFNLAWNGWNDFQPEYKKAEEWILLAEKLHANWNDWNGFRSIGATCNGRITDIATPDGVWHATESQKPKNERFTSQLRATVEVEGRCYGIIENGEIEA